MIVLSFITIDVIIIVIWAIVSPYKGEEREVHSSNIFLKEVFVGCSCKHETKFMITLYCYKGLLLIFGLFLTWQTRYAKFKIRNESKDIAMAIYNVVATSVIGVICVTILARTTKHNAMYAVLAASIWLCNTTTLFLTFVPKVSLSLTDFFFIDVKVFSEKFHEWSFYLTAKCKSKSYC